MSLPTAKHFLTDKLFSHRPQNLSLPTSKYILTDSKIDINRPLNMLLLTTTYVPTGKEIFPYRPQYMSSPATKYLPTNRHIRPYRPQNMSIPTTCGRNPAKTKIQPPPLAHSSLRKVSALYRTSLKVVARGRMRGNRSIDKIHLLQSPTGFYLSPPQSSQKDDSN